MKLRIRGNSLRLRLSRSEVVSLRDESRVAERIEFGPEVELSLEYAVLARSDMRELRAEFTPNRIAVFAPCEAVWQWANDESQVGLSGEMPVGDGKSLKLLIEKDFACLTRGEDGLRADGEDDSDAYPHPSAALGAC